MDRQRLIKRLEEDEDISLTHIKNELLDQGKYVQRIYDERFIKANALLAKLHYKAGNKEKALEHFNYSRNEFWFMVGIETSRPKYFATGIVLRGLEKLDKETMNRINRHKKKLISLAEVIGEGARFSKEYLEAANIEIGSDSLPPVYLTPEELAA